MSYKIGIDEAGRGPWAGPVFASIVVLDQDQEELLRQAGITDSKKLNARKREDFFSLILKNCTFAKVKFFSANEIDKIGIYKSTIKLIEELVLTLDPEKFANEEVLIDGIFPNLKLKLSSNQIIKHECIIKGDAKEVAISAASILAKVRRDNYMQNLDTKYPNFQFARHKGYGTKLHQELINQFGICDEHRKSFKPIKLFS